MDYVVEMLGITKRFPGIVANDNVTLRLKQGEIHALLGENGAGKSTLMSILFGLYQPDEGEIHINGEKVEINDPKVANKLGIGMVHQHFKLVENFTVLENIILGSEPKGKFGSIDMKAAREKVKAIIDQYGLNVDLDAKIQDIGVGMQQRVEILKILYRDANILILDEPTAVLTPQEISELIKIMQTFITEGKSIILITHKLKEIKQVADNCSILRKGKYIGTVDVKTTSESEMANMMVGRNVSFNVVKEPYNPGRVILSVQNLTVKNENKLNAVSDVSFDVKAGEVFCLCGIDGNGQSEIIEAITGLKDVESGKIFLDNDDITNKSIRQKTMEGIGHIPEDRHKFGLVLDFNLEENIALQSYYTKELSNKGKINFSNREKLANELIDEFDIRTSELRSKTIVRSMSGGNQQKAIIAREINRKPKLMIASQPTRGLDIGAIEYIHKRLIDCRDSGNAVLLLSLELDEVLDLSDVIAVVHQSKIVGILDAKEANEKLLGLMMAGMSKEEAKLHLETKEVANEN